MRRGNASRGEHGYGAMYTYFAFMGLLTLVLFLWAVVAFLDSGEK